MEGGQAARLQLTLKRLADHAVLRHREAVAGRQRHVVVVVEEEAER